MLKELGQFGEIKFQRASEEDYRFFRAQERGLVAVYDSQKDCIAHDFFRLDVREKEAALTSMVIYNNNIKKDDRRLYARLDIVIVLERYRELGLARGLVYATLLSVLREYSNKLYSLSCLAGHLAIGRILEELDFKHLGSDKNFERYELSLNQESEKTISKRIEDELIPLFKAINFRVRQRRDQLDAG